MSDELSERLTRLAPAVDDAASFATLGQPRRGRAALIAAGLAAAAIATGGVLFALRDTGGETVTAGTTTSTAAVAPLSASTTRDGIEVTVTLPAGRVEVGRRVHAEVTIRNVGSVPISWQAGGCSIPASVILEPEGWTPPQQVRSSEWNGATPLADWLATGNSVSPSDLVDPRTVGIRSTGCTADSRFSIIVPGGETSWTGATDFRVPPGPLATQELVATFTGYSDPADFPTSPRPPVQVRVTAPIEDDRGRQDSADDAIAAFADDHRLSAFLDQTRDFGENPNHAVQSWHTELSWWQGAWELWVYPYFNGNTALRMRYDTDKRAIVDARLISMSGAPSDDPDHASVPSQTQETILR
jgi:hypothetical protein